LSCRSLVVLGLLAALGPAAAARGQVARVGAQPASGGTVLGRVCLDLDRDGACQDGEPGIAGARVRFEDGRRARADDSGRFHAAAVPARILLGDRAAYGDHAVGVDGLGVRRRFELAPGATVSVDLPVDADGDRASAGAVEPRGGGVPRVEGAGVVWPVGGTAAPGARIRGAGREATAGDDGRWTLGVPLAEGGNAIGLSIEAADAVALWRLDLRVVRPDAGALRVYPSAPVRLASMSVRPAGEGVLLVGRTAPGVELRVAGSPVRSAGEGRFGAFGSAGAATGGPVAIQATMGDAKAEVTVSVADRDRPFAGLFLGELEVQLGGEAGFLASGRVAGSIGGRWRGFELDVGADLDDRDRSALDLTSARDALASGLRVDPSRGWLETGDRAALSDANPGRGRLWARAEGNGLRLELGGARTGMTGAELGRYDRAFFGGRVQHELALGPVRVGAVVLGGRVGPDASGLSVGAPCQDELAATGGSLYYLSRRNLVAGSERLRIEWRDPISRLVVASRELSRGRDYDLDLVGGRLLLARPLATLRPAAALIGGDPFEAAEAWLVADYLHVDAGEGERGIAGAELRGVAGPVALAVGGATESRPGADWQLAAASAKVDLGAPLRATVEVARSDGSLHGGAGRATSLDGGFHYGGAPLPDGGAASAVHARIDGEAGPASWAGWWRERPAGYSDGTFEERVAARERGALVQGKLGRYGLRLAWVERRGADPRDPYGASRLDVGRAQGAASLGVGPVDLGAEVLHERLTLPTRGRQSAAGLRAGWRAARGLRLEASHLQSFARSGDVESRTFTSAGVALDARELALAVRAGWGPDMGPRLLVSGERGDEAGAVYGKLAVDPESRSIFDADSSSVGARQRVAGGSLFTEERVGRDAWGNVSGRVIGAALTPADGLAIVLSGERGERWLGGTTSSRSAGALSVAWSGAPVRIDGRGEWRTEGSGDQWLAGAGVEWPATSRLTFAARALASDGELRGRRARGGEGWLSGAWRSDVLSVLARLGALQDDRDGSAEREATIGAVALTAKVLRRATVGAGLDAALQRVGGVRDDRLAANARGEVSVWGPLDVALEYARRGSLDGRQLGDLDAVRLEAGVTASGVRLALGYTLVGFRGTGIDPAEETDGRFYLRAVVVR
jgi:hypothetical protein